MTFPPEMTVAELERFLREHRLELLFTHNRPQKMTTVVLRRKGKPGTVGRAHTLIAALDDAASRLTTEKQ